MVDCEKVLMELEIGFFKCYICVIDCGLVICCISYYLELMLFVGIYVGGCEKSVIESVLDI